ncbi:MAG: acyl-ACP--UDP-N-acetylglucosamine O-acyltransferase [Sumerlaeia bacterium]
MPIHPTASIHPSAQIADDAEIGANVIVKEECVIGPGCEIMAGAVIGPRTRMGAGNRVHYYAVIGHEPQFIGFDPSTPSGTRIGDRNEFREHSFIHRGLKPGQDTVIGNECYIMGHGHIAHDCIIGNNVVIASFCAVAGHVEVGDRAFLSGNVAIHQFARIGRMAMVGGMTGVSQDIPPFCIAKESLARIYGLNVVGLRRGGVDQAARKGLQRAFRACLRTSHSPAKGAAAFRAEWGGEPLPGVVEEFLTFCETKSKRGITSAVRETAGASDE